ncbi:MAG: hypothetical protein M1820_010145 [Bogoriella megaspora]|nr:MAG: hypothetical protein M1820_010145 [Bogoriella megaspora]
MSTTLTTPNLMCASGRYQPPPIFEHWSKWTFVVRSAVELVIPTIKDYTPSGSPDSRVPAVAGDSFTITHPFETVLNPPHTPFPLNLAWGYVDTILLDVGLLPISGLASPLQALPKVSDFVIETLAAWYSPPPRSEDKLFTFTKSTSSQHANHQWKFIKRYELCNESIELVAQTSCKKPTRFHDPQ